MQARRNGLGQPFGLARTHDKPQGKQPGWVLDNLLDRMNHVSRHCVLTFSSRSRASRSAFFLLSSSCFLRRAASSRSASAAAAAVELRSSALPRGRKRSARRCLRTEVMFSSAELDNGGEHWLF